MTDEVKVEVEEVEPTEGEVQLMAAKQLLMEVQNIKRMVYESGSLMNGMLIMQVKFLLNGLMNKYKKLNLLMGESVTLKMVGRGKHASFQFIYSSGLQALVDQLREEALAQLKVANEEAQKVNGKLEEVLAGPTMEEKQGNIAFVKEQFEKLKEISQ